MTPVLLVTLSVLVAFSAAACSPRPPEQPDASRNAQDSANPMAALRMEILTDTDPKRLGVSPTEKRPHVWGIIMDLGYPEANVSLVALADDTVSLYFSSGGGIIGAGEHEPVRLEARRFVDSSEQYLEQLSPAQDTNFPEKDRVRFYVLTYSGNLTADVSEKELASGKHALSQLYLDGHKVIAQIREASDETQRKKQESLN